MDSLYGMKVFVTPDVAKMRLAPGDYVTPAYRDEIDRWLLSFFGTVNLVPDGEVYTIPMLSIVKMNPRTYAKIKGVLP